EFSWRYQLPALLTLPPAGALGITVIIRFFTQRRAARASGAQPVTSAGPADSAPEDLSGPKSTAPAESAEAAPAEAVPADTPVGTPSPAPVPDSAAGEGGH
ncbi:MAG: hypothetical protein ACRDNF_26400, partial [Streptosporangiaceae bacterium]